MSNEDKNPPAQDNSSKAIVVRIIQVLFALLFPAVLFFTAAGTCALFNVWIYFAVVLLYFLVTGPIMIKLNPEMVGARSQVKNDAKSWDKTIMSISSLLQVMLYIVAGLDAGRFHWSSLPARLSIPGTVLYILFTAFTQWAMVINKHFEGLVRIQVDRAHQVISSGPYRFVRHPGYLGMIFQNLLLPVIFGSAYAFIPVLIVTVIFIVRTALEDKTLARELPGYAEYQKRVKYRLLPGIW